MATLLLTGANGNVSGAAIRALQGSGHKLIGLVRDEAKAQPLKALGVELRVGDLSKPRSLEGAFNGVDTAFLLTTVGLTAPALASNALWAARQGGVKHIVRLSAVGAAHDAPTYNSRLHGLSDGELMHSGLTYTILKPHFFMQNLMMSAKSIAEEGVMRSALGDAKVPMIDVRDVGVAVAKVLGAPAAHAGKTYLLTGGTAVTMGQVAAAIGEAVGKPVSYQPIPVAAMVDFLAKMGADDYGQVSLRDYFTAYGSGWQGNVTSTFKDITGQEPRGIAEFARDFAGAFGKR